MSNQTEQFTAAETIQCDHIPDLCDEFNQKCIECGETIPDAEFAEFWNTQREEAKAYRRAVNLAIDSQYYADEDEEE